MDASGPINSAFTPPTPLFKSAASTLFADWGYFVPMAEGGFVAFQPQASSSSGGVISPSGWSYITRVASLLMPAFPSGFLNTMNRYSWSRKEAPMQRCSRTPRPARGASF